MDNEDVLEFYVRHDKSKSKLEIIVLQKLLAKLDETPDSLVPDDFDDDIPF